MGYYLQAVIGSRHTRMATTTVRCERHGVQSETFVCQHVADSLSTRRGVGFYWASEPGNPRPNAWCWACNERVKATGGDWIGEAADNLGARLLCSSCYDEARSLNLRTDG
jgi:hypothetical protein